MIHFVVPTFNAESHIAEFLANLESVSRSLGMAFRWTLITDLSRDKTGEVVLQFLGENPGLRADHVYLGYHHGQQRAILEGLKRVTQDEVCIVLDDDMRIGSADLQKLLRPVMSAEAEMVVAQHPARGLRKVTSFAFWFAYRFLSGNRVVGGRDLMFRAMSGSLVDRLTASAGQSFSVAIEADRLSKKTQRVRISPPFFLSRRSRYSSMDRFRLFVELIVVARKNLGHFLFLSALTLAVLALPLWVLAHAANLIDMFSQSSILGLIVVLMGSLNLMALGATQISLSLLMEPKGGDSSG